MLDRFQDMNKWKKVFAASITTTLIILVSFIIKDGIQRKRQHKNVNIRLKNQNNIQTKQLTDFLTEFLVILLSSIVSYGVVYVVLNIDM